MSELETELADGLEEEVSDLSPVYLSTGGVITRLRQQTADETEYIRDAIILEISPDAI